MALCACVGLLACSEDDSEDSSESAADSAGPGGPETGMEGGAEGDPSGPDNPPGACDNDHDINGLAMWDLGQLAYQCYPSCSPDPDPVACIVDCVSQSITGDDISPECLICYAEVLACTYADPRCTEQCAANAQGPDCTMCTCERGCVDAFEPCSGFPPFVAC